MTEMTVHSLLSAAIVGSQTQMREYLLRAARGAVNRRLYPLDEILANPSYLDVARLLIEHGADPAMGRVNLTLGAHPINWRSSSAATVHT